MAHREGDRYSGVALAVLTDRSGRLTVRTSCVPRCCSILANAERARRGDRLKIALDEAGSATAKPASVLLSLLVATREPRGFLTPERPARRLSRRPPCPHVT